MAIDNTMPRKVESHHSVKDMLLVVDMMHEKARRLENLIESGLSDAEIQYHMDDIKAHAQQLINDKGE